MRVDTTWIKAGPTARNGAAWLCIAILTSCSSNHFDPHAKVDSAQEAKLTTVPGAERIDPALLRPPTKVYTLGPGDKLDIEILGETGSRANTFVTPDGKLYYNLAPGIVVNGLSTTQVKQRLDTELAKYYRQPHVSVTLVDAVSQRIWVLGRLNAPGVYPLKRPLRVMDAVALAGGLFTSRFTGTTEELADLPHSFLMRNGKSMPVDFQKLLRDGDMSQNIYLQPNDFIYLPSSLTNEVYILGDVAEARPIGFMNEMNLMSAISKGLGALPDADLTRVTIVRGSLTDPKIAVVNAQAIMNGKETNVRLQPGDIIYIPGPSQLSLSGYVRQAVNTFVRVVAANEGGNAAIPKSAPTGVNIGIGPN